MRTLIATIDGVEVFKDDAARTVDYTAGMQVDVDGAPTAYHATERHGGLDDWASACYPDGKFDDILACDAYGKPVVQTGLSDGEPAKGFFIAMTAYQRVRFGKYDVRRYVDASAVPYVVIPSSIKPLVRPRFLGCAVEVTNLRTGRTYRAVCADVGPAHAIGEGSLALARLCGFPKASARDGIDDRIFRYVFHPGIPATVGDETFVLQ